jgi:hypothetical protein
MLTKPNKMKTTLLLLLFLLPAAFLWAQAPADDCDTLVLYPKRELAVRIDSIAGNKVYCRLCGSAGEEQQVIPLKMVAEVRGYEYGAVEPTAQSDSSSLVKGEDLIEREEIPKWLFSNRIKKKLQRKLEKGVKVTVTYVQEAKERRRTGRLQDINEEYIVIDTYKGILEIPKEDVIKLTPKKTLGVLGGLVGGLAIGVGLAFLLIVLVLLLAVLFITALFSGGQDANTRGFEEERNYGCTWGLIALLIGVFVILLSLPQNIKAPFSDDWKVEKITEEEGQETQQVDPERTNPFEDFELP